MSSSDRASSSIGGGKGRSLRAMTEADHRQSRPDTPGLTDPELALHEELRDLREELAARDERFALLEAEMWAGFEAREARQRQLLEEREQQLARARACEEQLANLRAEIHQRNVTIAELTESTLRLSVRLERILSSPPARLYAALVQQPGLNWLKQWRARGYSTALARHRPR